MSDQRTNGQPKRPTGEVGAASVQAEAQNHATGTDTVVVCCDIPMGHILEIFDVYEEVSFMQNGREIKENRSVRRPERWAVHGPVNFGALVLAGREINVDFRVVKGNTPDAGYALTPGIPTDFWDAWLEQNKRGPLVTGHHVFAMRDEQRASGKAKEFRDMRSGLQGLDPSGDYRVPSGRIVRKFDRTDNSPVQERPGE